MTPHVSRPGVHVPVHVDPAGRIGPTPGQARGGRWRRVGHGLYAPSSIDPSGLEQRIVEAVAGCPGSAATGWAALAWQHGRWFSGLAPDGRTPLPVPVALGDRRQVRPRPGVRISEDWLFDDDVTDLDGLPITRPERSVSYEVRRARSLVAAVRVIDMAAYDDLVDVAGLGDYAARLAGRPGTERLRTALTWAEENTWSPQEVALRIHWRRSVSGVDVRPNLPVFDDQGRHLLTPDLLDVENGVAGEYEGVVHLEGRVRRRDLNRDELCRELGLEVVTMTSADGRDLTDFLTRLHGAYRRAGERRGAPRRWTVAPPDWWVDTSTVAARRALDAEERAVWLRRRAS